MTINIGGSPIQQLQVGTVGPSVRFNPLTPAGQLPQPWPMQTQAVLFSRVNAGWSPADEALFTTIDSAMDGSLGFGTIMRCDGTNQAYHTGWNFRLDTLAGWTPGNIIRIDHQFQNLNPSQTTQPIVGVSATPKGRGNLSPKEIFQFVGSRQPARQELVFVAPTGPCYLIFHKQAPGTTSGIVENINHQILYIEDLGVGPDPAPGGGLPECWVSDASAQLTKIWPPGAPNILDYPPPWTDAQGVADDMFYKSGTFQLVDQANNTAGWSTVDPGTGTIQPAPDPDPSQQNFATRPNCQFRLDGLVVGAWYGYRITAAGVLSGGTEQAANICIGQFQDAIYNANCDSFGVGTTVRGSTRETLEGIFRAATTSVGVAHTDWEHPTNPSRFGGWDGVEIWAL